ncbi:MAG: 7TM diverse intracellular signaling domain-containing protein, partial [Nevskiales bacterium]
MELVNTADPASNAEDWVLEIGWPPLDHADAYITAAGGLTRVVHMGRQQPPASSGIAHRNHAAPLQLESGVPVTLYLRIQIEGAHQAPLRLWTAPAFAHKTAIENLRFGMIYGILLVMVLYNLLIFVTVRDRAYLYYLLFVFMVGGVQLNLDGFLHPLLWQLARPLLEESIPIQIALATVFGSLFIQTSLETRQYTPRLHRMLQLLVVIGAIGMVPALLLSNLHSTFINSMAGAFLALVGAVVILLQSYAGRRTARIYLFAWSLLFVGVVAKVMEVNALLPISTFTTYALHIGLCFLVTLLSLALADRINSERHARERLTREHAAAELAAKNEFLAKMSHELRTPMNAIVGFTDLALRDDSDAQRLEHLGQVDSAAQAMRNVLDDVFDLTQIEMGRLKLDRREFALQGVLDNVSARVGLQAAARNLTWSVSRSADVPEVFDGDAQRLEQVLLNLTDNALKFTEQGRVELRVTLKSCKTRDAMIEFAVCDTGIGISSEQLSRLFTPFAQGDQSITRRHGGSGLGLVLSQQLVKLMGGVITVRSQPGQGSEIGFIVPLPLGETPASRLRKASVPTPPQATSGRLQGARILLVEDNATNRRLALEILRDAGVEVDTAVNGAEAVEAVQRNSYRAVLMDLQMPEMDGFEATRRIRGLPGFGRLPIIAMTANAMTQDRAAAMACGMSDFLAKPIDSEQLLEVMAKWMPARIVAPPAADPPGPGPVELPASLPGIDIQDSLRRLAGRQSLLVDMLRDLVREQADVVTRIQDCLNRNQQSEARRAAHSLKGVAGNLGCNTLADAARAVEDALMHANA